MKVRAAELESPLLEGAIALLKDAKDAWLVDFQRGYPVLMAQDWSCGGPDLELLLDSGMKLERVEAQFYGHLPKFRATFDGWLTAYRGDSVLVAAYRCAVAKHLGVEFDLDDDFVAAIQAAQAKHTGATS